MLTVSRSVKRALRSILPVALAPAVLLASSRPAEAVLNYYLYQDGPDVVLSGLGSLVLPQPTGANSCQLLGFGALVNDVSLGSIFCTGQDAPSLYSFAATPAASFNVPGFWLAGTSSPSTLSTALLWGDSNPDASFFFISDPTSAGSISSISVFANTNLNDLGFTTPGLLRSWTLLPANEADPYTANDVINLIVGAPAVPGPLPLLGAAAAFASSRRLRRRLSLARGERQP